MPTEPPIAPPYGDKILTLPAKPHSRQRTLEAVASKAYVELSTMTNYSFLEAASHAEELAFTAAALGMTHLGIADRNSMAGIVRAHVGCHKAGIRLVVGCRLSFRDAPDILAYPIDRAAYGRLCTLLTVGRRRARKGECHIDYVEFVALKEGFLAIVVPPLSPHPNPSAQRGEGLSAHSAKTSSPRDSGERVGVRGENKEFNFSNFLKCFHKDFGRDGYLALTHYYRGDDARRLREFQRLADVSGLTTIAINDVRHHHPDRKTLFDVLTCVRHHTSIDNAGFLLEKNAERHLKDSAEMHRLFRGLEESVTRTMEIVKRCTFSLDELKYEYPEEIVTVDKTPLESLREFVQEGARWRYDDNVPPDILVKIEHELSLIARFDYARYFLTVHDLVRFAREQNILHQGRGSAANSVVCFCLGITSIDPTKADLLFERFISAARQEPPDIDVDFEHERREEVIQYIYKKYGRDRAGIAATIICYRSRAALRDVGRVLGLSDDIINRMSKIVWGWSDKALTKTQIRQAGLDPSDRRLTLTVRLAGELIGTPRHLSQHVGGFVISKGPLSQLVPIENAAMEDRTVIQWDKDDLDAVGLLKVDILALGMLSCIRRAFDFIHRIYGKRYNLATVPQDDPMTYEMLCRADSIGVFQVESRAQMSMLPRLRPRTFYDLVIEVAIVRPGPIQGDMVHPYLKRRNGEERSIPPSPALAEILKRTEGVPLFQEQVMRIAMVGAGFTADESDDLRRAMATFKKVGTIQNYRKKFIAGMLRNGYKPDFAEGCFRQIEGFANYGFPESHAASFALLVYVSAWIKCHYPAVFAAALLNSQPMGFYAPAQIVRDAREHGVRVRHVDVNLSHWDCDLEGGGRHADFATDFTDNHRRAANGPILRLGLRQADGLKIDEMTRLVALRADSYQNVDDLWRRSGLSPKTLARLAQADAFRSLGLDRRQALWAVKSLGEEPLPLFAQIEAPETTKADLPDMPFSQHVVEDYQTLRLSLKRHPLTFLRETLNRRGIILNHQLGGLKNGARVFVGGLVLVRQRPGTASGVIFVTLEDETGIANLVVWPKIFATHRAILMGARLMACQGRVQIEGKPPHQVVHVVAEKLMDMSELLIQLHEDKSRSTHPPVATADKIVRSSDDTDPRQRRRPTLLTRSRDFH